MIDLKQGFDSAVSITKCDLCKNPIGLEETKILYGTGNSLLAVFHKECETWHRKQFVVFPVTHANIEGTF